MSLSWNEIKTRAAAFVNEWKDIAQTAREEAVQKVLEARLKSPDASFAVLFDPDFMPLIL